MCAPLTSELVEILIIVYITSMKKATARPLADAVEVLVNGKTGCHFREVRSYSISEAFSDIEEALKGQGLFEL